VFRSPAGSPSMLSTQSTNWESPTSEGDHVGAGVGAPVPVSEGGLVFREGVGELVLPSFSEGGLVFGKIVGALVLPPFSEPVVVLGDCVGATVPPEDSEGGPVSVGELVLPSFSEGGLVF